MTVRSEGQFNTVVYEEEDLYRGQERRDIILMNPADMKRLCINKDDRVAVRSEIGTMHGVLARPYDIKPGNVCMYYPEANVLVPRDLDHRSKTPAFKAVAVRIERMADSPAEKGVYLIENLKLNPIPLATSNAQQTEGS